jgi:hypothetical protein
LIGLVLGRLDLEVVALDEERVEVAFLDGCGDHHRAELGRRLLGVAHLAARDLEDQRAGVGAPRRAQGRARVIVGEADVHRRHGAVLPLALAPGDVELVDAGRSRAQRLADFPDHPAGEFAHGVAAEDRAARQRVDGAGLQLGHVDHLDAVALDDGSVLQTLPHFISAFENIRRCRQ